MGTQSPATVRTETMWANWRRSLSVAFSGLSFRLSFATMLGRYVTARVRAAGLAVVVCGQGLTTKSGAKSNWRAAFNAGAKY